MTRAVAVLLTAVLTLAQSAPAYAYLKFGFRIGGQTVDVKWANAAGSLLRQRT